MKSNNLREKICNSLIIFSVVILCFLWFFQVLFLNSYYEWQKTMEMRTIITKIQNNYKSKSFEEILDHITFNKGVCIEIVDENNIYSSNFNSRECMNSNNKDVEKFKNQFISSNKERQSYKIKNQFGNDILFNAVKLDNNLYAFVNVSLQPMDSTVKILSSQLLIVTFVVLILSFVIAYFISKKIAKPIINLTKQAHELSLGNYDINFDNNTSIKEINELSDTLNQARESLSKTEELRRELMANVSHDLKTPLTMIKAYAEMVRDLTYNDKEKREKNLNTIIDETDRLTILVNDILDLSKLQSNVDELVIEEFDLNETIKNIINRFDYLKERDGFIFEYNEVKNVIIKADKKKIEQVIYNLIGNAINYVGEDKKIIIKLINKENITVKIIDHGKGIDKNELDNIWDKYYKIDKKHQRNYVGTGLGLSIVKNVLERHNYKYGVKSTKGKGTTFYFEIEK